ncbi:hypothetical protein PINS_up012985 [Pythium insidiosum]|nr:hypothetical protein PINS_up012985 [Pythium insidiosum]
MDAEVSIDVDDIAMCKARNIGCGVKRWRNAAVDAPRVVFLAANPQHSPTLQTHAKNSRAVVRFGCPMQTTDLVVRELMTVFFVLEPNQVEQGDTYRGQKFFGNVPYGQFLLHGGKPGFFSTAGLHEIDSVLPSDALSILVYRLHRDHIEIKLNRDAWSSQTPSATPLRITTNGALNLGNVRGGCDTNAFQGAIAEILIYDAILSDQAVDRIEEYLHDKWVAITERSKAPATVSSSTVASLDDTTTQKASNVALSTPSTAASTEPAATEEALTTAPTAARVDELPRTFDPEGVFEWLPSDALLAAIGRGRDAAANLERWKSAVREKIDAVRNFAFGGPVLRQFIHERRDELLTLRVELFG